MSYADPQDMVKSILSDNWDSSNTDDLTPEFIIIEDFSSKRYNMGYQSVPNIFIYAKTGSKENANGIGSQAKRVTDPVSIDIRCPRTATINKEHFVKVIAEILRILEGKIKNPSADFDYIDPEMDKINLSDKKSGIWRMVIDIKARRMNVAITAI